MSAHTPDHQSSSFFAEVSDLRPVNIQTEEEKLAAYQRAISMLPPELQNAKMNAVHAPKTLRRFLSAQSPENLVARFSHRLEEVDNSTLEQKLTPEERRRIVEIEQNIQKTLHKYLDLANQETVDEQDFALLIIEIYQGKTKLNVALGLIQENTGNGEGAKTTYRNAIHAGHMEAYRMLVDHHIRNEDFTSAYQVAKEALAKKFTMPAMDLAQFYYINGSDQFCKHVLSVVNPNDHRTPHVILLEDAIHTGDFDRIEEITNSLNSKEDTSFLIAASFLRDGHMNHAIQAFADGLQIQSCTDIHKKLNKLLKAQDIYQVRVFIAEHLRFVLTGYGLEEFGNHLVNQTKN
jgi:hypothetical protein